MLSRLVLFSLCFCLLCLRVCIYAEQAGLVVFVFAFVVFSCLYYAGQVGLVVFVFVFAVCIYAEQVGSARQGKAAQARVPTV